VRLHKVGQGTFSSVYKALDTATGRHVALKKVRLDVCDEEAVLFATREVRPRLPWRGRAACCARHSRGGKLTPSLSTLVALPQVLALRRVDHPNVRDPLMSSHLAREPGLTAPSPNKQVLKILAVAVPPHGSDTALYLVLDYHPHDLAGALASRAAAAGGAPLPEGAAKSYVQQLLCALDACHQAGVIHRDVKCSNLLIADDGRLVLGDLGLAALVAPTSQGQHPPCDGAPPRGAGVAPLTNRVITLWYRPPELLLGATSYGHEVDLWSAGCIAAELHTGVPLLPGRTEVEQLHRIFKLCGSDGACGGQGGDGCAGLAKPPTPYPRLLAQHLAQSGASPEAVELIETLLCMTPGQRGTAAGALCSPYFAQGDQAWLPHQLPRYPPGSHELAMRRKRAAAKLAHGVGSLTGTDAVPVAPCGWAGQQSRAAEAPFAPAPAPSGPQMITPPAVAEQAPRRMSYDVSACDWPRGGRDRRSSLCRSDDSGSDETSRGSLDIVMLPEGNSRVIASAAPAHFGQQQAAAPPFCFG
jgi:cyclin-dependent kinase 12/13